MDGGVEVTGSHNPPEYNGFKICVGKTTFHGEEIQALRELIEARPTSRRATGGTCAWRRRHARTWRTVVEQFGDCRRKLEVVVDAGNGAGGPIGLADATQRSASTSCRSTASSTDASRNHHPDPTLPENLRGPDRARCSARSAELGIAFDGDADRIGVVDGRAASSGATSC